MATEDDTRRLYARLANASYVYYRDKSDIEFDGYILVQGLSDNISVVLVNNNKNEIVLSIRGTDVKNAGDIYSDIAILGNFITTTDRFRLLSQKCNTLINMKKRERKIFNITGHSLGGLLCFELIKKYINDIDNAYLYNIGFGPMQFIDNLKKRIVCKIVKTRQCREEQELKKKLHIYVVRGDIVSNLSLVHPSTELRRNIGSNPHSLENLINGAWLRHINNLI